MLLHESANMEQSVPENLSTHVFNDCEIKLQTPCHDPMDSENGSNSNSDLPTKDSVSSPSATTPSTSLTSSNGSSYSTTNTTKVKLSFSVDRLLSAERIDPLPMPNPASTRQCCDGSVYACCTFSSCFGQQATEAAKHASMSASQGVTNPHNYNYAGLDKFYSGIYMDYKSVLRPTPIRAADHATTFPSLATNALLRFHQQQQQHLAPLNSLKTLQLTQQQRFLAKTAHQQLLDIPSSSISNNNHSSNNSNGKRKRSWSRAVFTNLQRKGLEIQFQQQKYITKPDRRKLAARLNLTDAQVKVWFQNRRMKWRHTRENLKSGHEKQPQPQGPMGSSNSTTKPLLIPSGAGAGARPHELLDYSSDSCSSVELSERADDDDNIEIDVVE
ncbi:uncharacterized protein Dmoj_GI11292 [Drosophila mojavensis]|uniref:Homeobox domain-containing protein n=1 Tax=Drosophila mojavensis TaxID=7230 RepID=B4KGG9_DROMO|nr:uncharacterized protein Dmoj_GI11292 [Drosophila mojavensis]